VTAGGAGLIGNSFCALTGGGIAGSNTRVRQKILRQLLTLSRAMSRLMAACNLCAAFAQIDVLFASERISFLLVRNWSVCIQDDDELQGAASV
jgi:hypothetical protein